MGMISDAPFHQDLRGGPGICARGDFTKKALRMRQAMYDKVEMAKA